MLTPGKFMSLLDMSSATVGTKPMAELDIEMTPILAELVTLSFENNEHLTLELLFNWLVAPERTGEEFYYVTGPLHWHVLTVMMEHFPQYVNMDYNGIPENYLGKIAAEALAVKYPILEGHWELAAWVVVIECGLYCQEDVGAASVKLTDWIIHVIGNPILCPNPYLRIELILLNALVDEANLKNHSLQAFESLLFACSSLNLGYLLESKTEYGYIHQMDLITIIYIIENDFSEDFVQKFDETLAKKLWDVKKLRLSAQIHDVAYHYAVNSNQFEDPMALHGLSAILRIINGYIRLSYKDCLEKNPNFFSSETGVSYTTRCLAIFINCFKKSCWTPQLLDLTVTCILTTMKIVISEFAITRNRNAIYEIGMDLVDMVALLVVDENICFPEVMYGKFDFFKNLRSVSSTYGKISVEFTQMYYSDRRREISLLPKIERMRKG